MGPATVSGFTTPRFAPVREAFAASFAEGEVGAACAVYHRGERVVDLWGGQADPGTGRAWAEDTTGIVFSATKGVTAACVHLLAERGKLDLDAPVAAVWPAFAAEGKGAVPVRWLLCHKAGVPAIDAPLSLAEVLAWDPVVAALAAQRPLWEPGTAHGYHARTFGWGLGEVVRRADGRSLGRFLAEEVAAPLGLDLWVGLPPGEAGRRARLLPPAAAPGAGAEDDASAAMERLMSHPDLLFGRVLRGPNDLFRYDDTWNRADVLAAEMPSSNGVADARSLARLYAALVGEVDGVRLLSPATLEAARAEQACGPDRVLLIETRFASGFALPPMLGTGVGPAAFGHPGAGGSLAFADPEAGLGFGYVMNQMRFGLTGDPRSERLVAAVYRCL